MHRSPLMASPGGAAEASYRTFAPPSDVNGDGRVDEWDEALRLGERCLVQAHLLARAATHHANVDWWLGVLLVVTNALTTATGVSTATAALTADGGPGRGATVPVVTASLCAVAGLLAGLQRSLQPADRAAQCRAARREFERLADQLEAVSCADASHRPEDAQKYLETVIQAMADAAAPDAVADALARLA